MEHSFFEKQDEDANSDCKVFPNSVAAESIGLLVVDLMGTLSSKSSFTSSKRVQKVGSSEEVLEVFLSNTDLDGP